MKILISWLEFRQDFKKAENGEGLTVNENGATVSFHRDFYNHDKHIIFYTDANSETRTHVLVNYLLNNFKGRQIECVSLNIKDPINVPEIMSKVTAKLTKYSEHEIDVYISPGTPAMQTVWYLIYMNDAFGINLYQTREARHTAGKKEPELIKINIQKSSVPITAVIYESEIDKYEIKNEDDYELTSSVQEVYDKAELVAKTDGVTTLILGESGSGKENLSQFIHKSSRRSDKVLLSVNCSAFSDELLESRLFGYKKGAFTGAHQDMKGLFEEADGGSVFLDEIGDISPYMQQSLLRVLQSGEINPVGSNETIKVDVRVICATNRDLVEMCKNGEFRWDLFYRLAVVELRLPALRHRGKDEVKQTIKFFLKGLAKTLKKKQELKPSKEAMEIMVNYSYPGNVRELINIISRLYVFKEEEILPADLPHYMKENDRTQEWSLETIEKKHIKKTLEHFDWNLRQTAIHLGCSDNTLRSKIGKYELRKG